ncbi:MAG: hypothetical protein AAB923_00045 [Patescibacteria group bacterium]
MDNFLQDVFSVADAHSAGIQAISTIVLVAIATLALIWNERMAKVMQKTYELGARPYAGIDANLELVVEPRAPGSKLPVGDTEWIELKYKILNLGAVAVVYTVVTDNFKGKPADSQKESEVVLYPKQVMNYYAHYEVPPTKVADLRGMAEIGIEYWALGIPEKRYFHKRIIEIQPFSNYKIIKDEAGELSG